jgi:hypothetical protein
VVVALLGVVVVSKEVEEAVLSSNVGRVIELVTSEVRVESNDAVPVVVFLKPPEVFGPPRLGLPSVGDEELSV